MVTVRVVVMLVIRMTSGPKVGCFPVVQTWVIVVLPWVLVVSLQIALAGSVMVLFVVSRDVVWVTLVGLGRRASARTGVSMWGLGRG